MSVRKTLGLVKRAAEDAGVAWPDSAQSSAKRQRVEGEAGQSLVVESEGKRSLGFCT